jgi:hypothetical protein
MWAASDQIPSFILAPVELRRSPADRGLCLSAQPTQRFPYRGIGARLRTVVSSPRSASNATLALNSAEYRVRLPVIDSVLLYAGPKTGQLKHRGTAVIMPDNGMMTASMAASRTRCSVLGITIYSHRDLEQLLRGFNAAYNARRQPVLQGRTPNQMVAKARIIGDGVAPISTGHRA